MSKQQSQANLTGKMSGSKPSLYRSKTEMDKMFSGRPSTSTPVKTLCASTVQKQHTIDKDKIHSTPLNHKLHTSNISNRTVISSANVVRSSNSQVTPMSSDRQSVPGHIPSHTNTNTQAQVARKLFPQFKPKHCLMPKLQSSAPSQESTSPRVVPIFKAHSGQSVAKPCLTKSVASSFANRGSVQMKPAVKSAPTKAGVKSVTNKAKSGTAMKREKKQNKDKQDTKKKKLQKAED